VNVLPFVGFFLAVAALGCVPDEWKTVASQDAGSEVGVEVGVDAGVEVGVDAGGEVGVDAGAEVDVPCGAACACSPGQMYCDDGCVEGPTSVYDGEDSADDGAGDLHATNAPVDYADGHRGRAFSFGGDVAQSYVELPSAVSEFGTGDFTISLWFNASYRKFNQSIIARRLSCGVGPAFSGFDVRLAYTGGLFVELWTTAGHHVVRYLVPDRRALHDSQWHHIAIVREGPEVRLVVDGVVSEVSPIDGSMNDSRGTPLYLGVGRCVVNAPRSSGGWDDTRWFQGRLDEVAFFRRALTAAELTATVEGRCSR